MKKRTLAFLLAFVMILGCFAGLGAGVLNEDVTVYGSDGKPADSVTLPKNEKTTLTADAQSSSAEYQWQIRVSDDVWANIVGSDGKTLELSYAMVASLLDGDTVDVRCRLTDGSDDAVYSNVVTVTVTAPAQTSYASAKAAPAVKKSAVAAQSDPAETPSTYTIIINYIFADGSPAANQWTATITKGSSYRQTVTSPTVVGYAPDKESVDVNVANASKDVTYTVIYSAAEVNFTVKHYQQNLENDNYTLVDTETRKGYTATEVGGSLAKTYEGFYSLLYDTTTKIAADGSTEVEIYYDRYYYLMSFDLDGGYGVEPIYARYGAPISVGEPTKAGYSFAGWDKTLPGTMPAENSSYKATWTAGDAAKVTIVVWGENADDEEYSFYHNSEIMAKPGEKLTLDSLQGKLICGKEEHTHSDACATNCDHVHSAACYGGTRQEKPVDGKTGSASENVAQFKSLTGGELKNGMVYRVKCDGAFWTSGYDKYYLYFNTTWYLVSSNNVSGSAVASSSKMNAHDHSGNSNNNKDQFWAYNAKLNCTHTHDDSCYTCGKVSHTHTSACYYNGSFMENPNLWKLVKSDEVTVAADGTTILNVYYDRVEFTLTFIDNRSTVATIRDKWGAEISGEFQKEPFSTKYNGQAWVCTDSNKYSYALQTLDRMPAFDATFNLYGASTTIKKTIYYYVQKVGTTVNANQWPSNANNFDLLKQVDTYFNYATYNEEYHEIQGFTRYSAGVAEFNNSNRKDFRDNRLDLYYMRNSYTLKFYNHDGYVEGADKTVQYEAPLKDHYFVPDYPAGLEPNAYVFAGWYTTAGCYDGSEADLNKMTMPASDVILYAKWTPKTHTVKTYLTKDAMDNDADALQTWDAVPHGTAATPKADTPTNGKYTFVGWFYQSDDPTPVEKAFDFSMPVNRDLNLYAKWISNTLVTYTIRYELEDGTEIAPPTKGSALAGATRTFDAKAGEQLNAGYQSGYFPKTSSHSLTMNIEGGNEFTFVYVPKQEVNYTVRYLERGTNEVLRTEKHAATRDAVITEKFEQIAGYAPDAYQKRLVLSADEESNVITFWYSKDDVHAPVQIIHWTQNIAGDGYTEYQSSTDLNGIIGQTKTEDPLNLTGYVYNEEKSNASGEVTAEGLVLNLYYDRIEYPYEFRFLEQGTENELALPVKGNARYQAQVTQDAITIPGYKLVNGMSETQRIVINIEDPENVASRNVLNFYYEQETVDIKYEVVGPTGSGTLDNYQDNGIGVISADLNGSTPTAEDGFKFVGWFKDEACTQPVSSSWVDANSKLTPGKTKDYGNGVMGYEAATYYAKFEYDVSELTITKTGANEELDANQSFIFHVTGEGKDMYVTVQGNGSVTIKNLKVGKYKVEEVTSWSWRYTPTVGTQTVEVKGGQKNEVKFVNERTNGSWLSGDSYAINRVGGKVGR